MNPTTEADFQHALGESPYYGGRWGYYHLALGFAGRPESVLELGPHRLPLFPGGDTMDMSPTLAPTFRHDARVLPWPVETGRYDLFVALQVWEHLGASQADAFSEVVRIARRAVLSFPWEWDCPNDPTHHGVNAAVVARWTLGVPVAGQALSPDGARLVCCWEFADRPTG